MKAACLPQANHCSSTNSCSKRCSVVSFPVCCPSASGHHPRLCKPVITSRGGVRRSDVPSRPSAARHSVCCTAADTAGSAVPVDARGHEHSQPHEQGTQQQQRLDAAGIQQVVHCSAALCQLLGGPEGLQVEELLDGVINVVFAGEKLVKCIWVQCPCKFCNTCTASSRPVVSQSGGAAVGSVVI